MSNLTEKLDFKVNKKWEKYAKNNSWLYFIPEFAKDNKGQEYIRPKGRLIIYKIVSKDDKGNYKCECINCNSEILGSKVAHPIWDGPFPGSGSGKCHYETVPYCPNCEKKPNFSGGIPIEVGEKIR